MQKLGLAAVALVALTCPSRADWSFDRTRPAALLKGAGSDSPVIRVTCAGKDQARIQMAYPDDRESRRGKLKVLLAAESQQVTLEGQAKRVVFQDDDGGTRKLWNVIGQVGFRSPVLEFLRAGGVAQVAAMPGASDGYDVPLTGAAVALDRLETACREAALKAERLAAKAPSRVTRTDAVAATLTPTAQTAAPPARPGPSAPAPELAALPPATAEGPAEAASLPAPVAAAEATAAVPPAATPLEVAGQAAPAPAAPEPVEDPVTTASLASPKPETAGAGSLEYPCFPDACYGDTLLGTEAIGSDPDGTLVRARLKGWMKIGDSDRKPTPETNVYVYCSKTHPAVMTDLGSEFAPQFLSPGERSHYDDPSAALDIYLFFAACHGEFQPTYARAVELGYGDLRQESRSLRLARPEDILEARRRS